MASFRKTWNSEDAPVSDNAAFTNAAPTSNKANSRCGPTLNELQDMDQKQLTPIKPMSRRRAFYWKGRLLFFAVALVFGVISASWRQLEKVAPGLNKTIHSNVGSQEDVDYHGAKLDEARAQYHRAITQAPGQSTADFNKQFTTQGPIALKAMEYETAELMQAVPHEKVTGECRPLIDSMFKETQAYYRVEELIFETASTGGTDAQFKAIGTLEDTAIANQGKAIAARDADKSCKGF
jgi:hypothetical protein